MRRVGLLGLALLAVPSNAATYEVGPGRTLTRIGDVPWARLNPGDTVLIHWRPDPYREKWVIGRSGTPQAPITVRGVPNAQGDLPIIDGQNAVTAPGLQFLNQHRGLVKIGASSVPDDSPIASDIVVELLELRNARAGNVFSTTDGDTAGWADNAAGFYIERGRNITLRRCRVHDNGFGMFAGTYENQATRNILFEANYVYNNGYASKDDHHHNSYIESIGVTYQYNYFGRPRSSEANNLKDRSAGTVVRYNWIEGGDRQLDLVDSGSQTVRQDPSYRQTFVYGNVLIELDGNDNCQIIHYGGDGNRANYRAGTLYLYHNTVVSHRKGWTTLVRLSTRQESADIRNNIVHLTTTPTGFFSILLDAGTAEIRNNWLQQGWIPSTSPREAVVRDMDGNITGTNPRLFNVAQNDVRLAPASPAINAGTNLHAATLPVHAVTREYVRHQDSRARPVDGPLDLGAFEFELGPARLRAAVLETPWERF